MDKLKYVKLELNDGTYSDAIPLAVDSDYVDIVNENLTNYIEQNNIKLNKKPYYYNSIQEMKSDNNLKIGDMTITLGYYEVNDGGAAKYKIVSGNYIDDGGSYHQLNNNLYAELIVENDTINVKQFGAKGNGIIDDTESIENCFKYKGNNYIKIIFNKNEIYLVKGTLHLYSNSEIILNNCIIKASSRLLILNNKESIKKIGYGALQNITIKNGIFNGNKLGILFGLLHGENIYIENIKFLDCSLASHIFDLGGCKNVNIINCNFIGSYINDSLSDKYFNELIQIDYANQVALPYWGESDEYQFDDLPTINVLIERCCFEIGNGNHYPNAIGTHAVYGVKAIDNIHIVNNIFNGCTYSNIRFPRVKNLVVEKNIFNTIENVNHPSSAQIIDLVSIYKDLENIDKSSDIIITNNKFNVNKDDVIQSAIKIHGLENNYTTNIFILNNLFEGKYDTEFFPSSTDFIQITRVDNIIIENNIIKKAKNSIYSSYDNGEIGEISILNNTFIDCRDILKCQPTNNYPEPFIMNKNNNTIIKGLNNINDSKFIWIGTNSEDSVAPITNNRLPINTALSGTNLIIPTSTDSVSIPKFIKRMKIQGFITIKNNHANDNTYYGSVRFMRNGLTTNINEFSVFCKADSRLTFNIPISYIDFKDWFTTNYVIYIVLTLNTGDEIIANRTQLILTGE